MHEGARQQYLAALGIDTYLPRYVLPGAAPGAPRDSTPDEPAQVAPDALSEAAPAPAGEAMPADLKQSLVAPATSQPRSVDPAPGREPHAAKAEPPRFTLNAWRVSDDLLAVDSRQLELALPTETLLRNILAALGYPPEKLPRAEVLRWPLSSSAGATNVAEAAAMVQAYLAAQQDKRPLRWLLLMGEAAGRFAAPDHWPADGDAPWGRHLPFFEGRAVLVPSLAAMLQNPALKAVTWQAIQPLRLKS